MTPHLSATGAVPTRLRLTLHKNVGAGAISLLQKVAREVAINGDSGNVPEWLENPRHKYKVDIVVLKIANNEEFKSSVTCHFLSEYQFQENFHPSVMDDAFVIGYPKALTGGDQVLPLFKRGSVASEPTIDYGSLPRFLIDCRTASAMSGSPVICSHSGLWPPGEMTDNTVIGTVSAFAGVYSGRLKSNEQEEANIGVDPVSEIGIVWKRKALDEIIENGVAGTKLSELS